MTPTQFTRVIIRVCALSFLAKWLVAAFVMQQLDGTLFIQSARALRVDLFTVFLVTLFGFGFRTLFRPMAAKWAVLESGSADRRTTESQVVFTLLVLFGFGLFVLTGPFSHWLSSQIWSPLASGHWAGVDPTYRRHHEFAQPDPDLPINGIVLLLVAWGSGAGRADPRDANSVSPANVASVVWSIVVLSVLFDGIREFGSLLYTVFWGRTDVWIHYGGLIGYIVKPALALFLLLFVSRWSSFLTGAAEGDPRGAPRMLVAGLGLRLLLNSIAVLAGIGFSAMNTRPPGVFLLSGYSILTVTYLVVGVLLAVWLPYRWRRGAVGVRLV